MSEMTLPAAVGRLVTAINEGDTDAFVDCFAHDAFIDDWGTVYDGHEGIRRWARTDAIGANATMTVVTAVTHGSKTHVRFGWTSEVFNGESTGIFDVKNDRIAGFTIPPSDS